MTRPSMIILDSLDIRFDGQRATLNFHDLKDFPSAEVFKTVHRLLRNVAALIFAEDQDISSIYDLGLAAYHHPVLASVFMTLEAQALPGKDFHKLHLKILSVIDHGIKSPRPADTFSLHFETFYQNFNLVMSLRNGSSIALSLRAKKG